MADEMYNSTTASTNAVSAVSLSVTNLKSLLSNRGACVCLNVSEKKDSPHISVVLCGTNIKTTLKQ